MANMSSYLTVVLKLVFSMAVFFVSIFNFLLVFVEIVNFHLMKGWLSLPTPKWGVKWGGSTKKTPIFMRRLCPTGPNPYPFQYHF